MSIGIYVKYRLFLSDFNENWFFSTDFRKNIQIPSLMKIRALGAEFFPCWQTDGRTDVTKLIIPFRNFSKAPKNRLLASSYLFVYPSVRSSGCLSVCMSVCLPACLSVRPNLDSNRAVLTGRMLVQFDSSNCWNTPFWLIADNKIGRFTWGGGLTSV